MTVSPLASHQAEEAETAQAEPIGKEYDWAEPGCHFLSRRPKGPGPRKEDGPAENSSEATGGLG